MFKPNYLHQSANNNTNLSWFGESRVAQNALSANLNKLGAMAGSAKESVKEGGLKDFLVKPKSLTGLMLKSPFYLPYWGAYFPFIKMPYMGLKWAGGLGKEYVTTSAWYPPAVNAMRTGKTIPVGAWNLTAGMPLEIGKSWLVRYPKYALADNIMTGVRGMVNIPATAISKGAEAAVDTAVTPFRAPYNMAAGLGQMTFGAGKELLTLNTRGALDNVLKGVERGFKPVYEAGAGLKQATYEAGRELLSFNIRGALKNVLGGAKRTAMAPIPQFARKWGDAAYSTAAEVGLMGASYGLNMARTAYAPFEGPINGLRRGYKGLRQITDSTRQIVAVEEGASARQRFSALLNAKQPFQHDFQTA